MDLKMDLWLHVDSEEDSDLNSDQDMSMIEEEVGFGLDFVGLWRPSRRDLQRLRRHP